MSEQGPLGGIRVVERAAALPASLCARAVSCRRALCARADVLLADETAPEADPATDRIDCRLSAWGAKGHPQGLPGDEALVAAVTGAQAMQWSSDDHAQRPRAPSMRVRACSA